MAISKAPATTRLTGNTDNTRIGNIGDALKVDNSGDGLTNDPTPPFQIAWQSTPLTNGSNASAAVNGSSTNQTFEAGPSSGEIWYITELSFVSVDAGTLDFNDFMGIGGGLSNGLLFQQSIDGTNYILFNLQNNADINAAFSSVQAPGARGAGWLDDDDRYCGSIVFDTPITLIGDQGDSIQMVVRDNLNGLDELRVNMKYWRRV